MKRFAPLALAGILALAATPPASAWSYTDGSGKTVTLDNRPDTLVMHANSAAGLIPFGIRPDGMYVDGPVEDDASLQGLDVSGVEIIGEAWGEIDIEKLAALAPDLIVAEWWPLEESYSGMESSADADQGQISRIAPVAGPVQGDSVADMIADYEALAEKLGADLRDPAIAARKERFEKARDAFKQAVAAKPGLTVMAVWAGEDGLYVAAPEGSAELSDFARWGMDIVTPEHAEDRGYWETLSWENADKYQPDLILVDDRAGPSTRETAEAQPTWTTIRAAQAGQVADWPAFWMRNYTSYADQLEELTKVIERTDPTVGD